MKRVTILLIAVSVVLFAAYGVITTYDYNMKVGRMWETPAVRPHEQPLLVMDTGLVPVTGGETLWRLAATGDLTSPLAGTPVAEVVAAGKILYGRYCQQCHGRAFDGQGTVGQSFAPLPGDLRSAKVQALSPGAMFKEISYGIPGGRQPALATTIAPPDRWRIIAFVKSLGARN
ncbi:MAG: c-type cytochrome [Pseudomonadota bacterium]